MSPQAFTGGANEIPRALRALFRSIPVALVLAFVSPAHAADATHGAQIFQVCAACHGVAGAGGDLGPRLVGIIGRKAGSLDTFRYSPAMERADFIWDEAKLKAFIADPRSLVRGTRMPFDGLEKTEDVEDVIAYISALK